MKKIFLIFGLTSIIALFIGIFISYQNINSTAFAKDTVTKADYIGEWEEISSGRIYINIEDMKTYIKVTYGGANSAYSNSESIYFCNYDTQTGDLICKNAKHVNTFASCNGISSEDNLEKYSECEEMTPDLIKEISKKYSDNKERILSIKKGNKNHSVIDEIEFFCEEERNDAHKNYKNMGLYFKKSYGEGNYYYYKSKD